MKPIPYPADTRAKGWRFELDHERIRQSDTWALASPEVRPWLLMLWMTAWEQTPCGSLPAEDELIAARIGMPAKTFAKHRAVLLRGWWPAEDGRLYHDTLVSRALEMLNKRRGNAQKVAEWRAAKREQPARNGLPTDDSQVSDDTRTRTSTSKDSYGPNGPTLSARGAVGAALKSAGLDPLSFNLADPRVDALIAAGATPEQWAGLAGEAIKSGKQSPWAWVLAVLPERLKAGKAIKPAGRHAGFAAKDYRAGVTDDGYIAAN